MSRRASAIVGAVAVGVCSLIQSPARATGCAPESAGVDTSKAQNDGEAVLGMALGETFAARDTLILSVTVWRIPSEHNDPSPMKLWITEVDSGGTPHTHLVVHEGPILSVTSPDSVKPTKIQFVFDPPIALPRPSQYCLWVQEICAGYFDLLTNWTDDFPDGHLWITYRSNFDGCILRDYPRSLPSIDLVFTIGFCQTSTPAHRTSWGELKLRYR